MAFVDSWTTGLQQDYPEIYERLERFMDECARCAGHERIPEEPAKEQYISNPAESEVFMAKMRKRRAEQRKATDARNIKLVKRMAAGKLSVDGAMRETGVSTVKSLFSTFKRTHERGGYKEYDSLYPKVRTMMNEYVKEQTRKAKEKKVVNMVFDGVNFIEVR